MKLDAMPMVSFYSLFCSPIQLYKLKCSGYRAISMSSEHSRVEGSEGLVVEPEDDVGTLPALAPGVGDDPAREVGRAPLQHLDTPGGR